MKKNVCIGTNTHIFLLIFNKKYDIIFIQNEKGN